MKEYESPKVELISFSEERILTQSGCNCHYDVTSNQMMIGGVKPECGFGESGGAVENPFGVAAPDWTFG